MIDISSTQRYNTLLLDTLAQAITPSLIGVSIGGYGSIVHLPDGTSGTEQSAVQAMFANFDTLLISADKTTLNEGDADPIITVNSSDAELGYVVLLDDDEYDVGDVTVIGGTATLNLVNPVAGTYQVFVYRKTGNYASGSAFIIVNEV